MVAKKRNVILINIVIVVASIMASLYYYYCLSNISIPFHSDDAGSTFALMDDKFFGGSSYLHNSYSIFAILERICCNIWGYTEFSTILVFGIQFFIMFFLTAIILIEKNDTWEIVTCKLVYLVWMCALLGVEGVAEIQISKFHTGPTIILLLILLAEKKMQATTKKKIVIAALVIAAFLQMDYVLSIVVVLVPLILVHIREYVKKDDYRKGIWCLLFLCSVCAILYVFCSIKGIPLELSIYGNRDFSSVKDIVDNISVFFKGLFGMFNCQIIEKKIVAVDFLPKFIRCAFLCMGIGYTVWYIVKSKERTVWKRHICIVILTVIAAFVMTGAQGDVISMRYCQCLLFLLPIISYDMLDRLTSMIKYRGVVAGIVVLSVSEFVIVNPNSLVYEFDDLTNTLEQNEISYAVAPYWSANVVSVLSEGTVLVQPCNIENGSLVQSDISTLSLYEDKATTFRTVISSVSQNESWDETSFGMIPENIVGIYGYPEKQITADEYHNVYVYDYDVRIIPREFEKTEHANFCMDGEFLGTYEISFMDIGREIQLQVEGGEILSRSCEDGWQKILISCQQKSDKLTVHVDNMTEQEINTNHVLLRAISETLPIEIEGRICTNEEPLLGKNEKTMESSSIPVKPGTYKLVLYGEKVRKVSTSTDAENVQMTAGECGDKRKIYYLQVKKEEEFSFKVAFDADDIQITNFSLEIDE